MSTKFHQAFGVYGILSENGKLAVIKKTGGPYINRYDLPGGTPEDGEEMADTVVREIQEETGLTVTKKPINWALQVSGIPGNMSTGS